MLKQAGKLPERDTRSFVLIKILQLKYLEMLSNQAYS